MKFDNCEYFNLKGDYIIFSIDAEGQAIKQEGEGYQDDTLQELTQEEEKVNVEVNQTEVISKKEVSRFSYIKNSIGDKVIFQIHLKNSPTVMLQCEERKQAEENLMKLVDWKYD